jgi:hypothetical protein
MSEMDLDEQTEPATLDKEVRLPWESIEPGVIAESITAHDIGADHIPAPGTPDFGEISRTGEGWGEGLVTSVQEDPHPNPLPEYREGEQEGRLLPMRLDDTSDQTPATTHPFNRLIDSEEAPTTPTAGDSIEERLAAHAFFSDELIEPLAVATTPHEPYASRFDELSRIVLREGQWVEGRDAQRIESSESPAPLADEETPAAASAEEAGQLSGGTGFQPVLAIEERGLNSRNSVEPQACIVDILASTEGGLANSSTELSALAPGPSPQPSPLSTGEREQEKEDASSFSGSACGALDALGAPSAQETLDFEAAPSSAQVAPLIESLQAATDERAFTSPGNISLQAAASELAKLAESFDEVEIDVPAELAFTTSVLPSRAVTKTAFLAPQTSASTETDADYDIQSSAPAVSTGGGWTIPVMCLGIGLIACCVVIPQGESNRELRYEQQLLQANLQHVQKQLAVNDAFLKSVMDDPTLAERLAGRQIKTIRKGQTIVPLKQVSDGGDMSPFALVAVAPPPAIPPYHPARGTIADLCNNARSRLYLLGISMGFVAVGLVMGFGAKRSDVSE